MSIPAFWEFSGLLHVTKSSLQLIPSLPGMYQHHSWLSCIGPPQHRATQPFSFSLPQEKVSSISTPKKSFSLNQNDSFSGAYPLLHTRLMLSNRQGHPQGGLYSTFQRSQKSSKEISNLWTGTLGALVTLCEALTKRGYTRTRFVPSTALNPPLPPGGAVIPTALLY